MTTDSLADCLPLEMRGQDTVIAKIAAGLSGAGVYRVDVGGQAYVLKVAADSESAADWARSADHPAAGRGRGARAPHRACR